MSHPVLAPWAADAMGQNATVDALVVDFATIGVSIDDFDWKVIEWPSGKSTETIPAWASKAAQIRKVIGSESLQPPLAKQEQPAAAMGTPSRFEPSDALAALIVDSVAALDPVASTGIVIQDAKDIIRNAVLRLLHSMAGSVYDSGGEPPHALAVNGEFADAFARAIMSRIPLKVTKWHYFLEKLMPELMKAAQDGLLFGPFWKVIVAPSNTLIMKVDRKPEEAHLVNLAAPAEMLNLFP